MWDYLSPPGMPAWAVVLVCAVCGTACVTDLRRQIVPNWLTYPAMLAGLIGHTLWAGFSAGGGQFSLTAALGGIGPGQMGLIGSALGLALGLLPLMLCWMLLGGITGGDAKLMGAMGALGGCDFVIRAAIFGFTAAALMAIGVMVAKGIVRQTLRRVWNTVMLLLTPGARPAQPDEKDSPKVPVAVGLCIGAVAALVVALWESPAWRRWLG